MSQTETVAVANGASATGVPGALEVRDTRTGQSYTIPVIAEGPEGDEAVRTADLKQVRVNAGDLA